MTTNDPPGRGWVTPVVLVMAATGVTQGFARFTLAVVLPDMTQDLLGSYSAAGVAGMANLGAYLLSVLVVGRISRRFDPSLLVKCGLTIVIVGMLVVATATHFSVLLIGMFMSGFGAAAVWIPTTIIVTAVVPVERRGFALGLSTAGIGISIVLTGRFTAVVHEFWGAGAWRPVWLIEIVIGTVILIAVVLLLRPVPAVSVARPRGSVMRRFPGGWALFACYGLFGVAYIIYTGFLVAALEDDRGFSTSHSSLAYSLLGVTTTAGGVLLGRVSDSIGRRFTLIAGYVATACCCVAVPLGTKPLVALSAAGFGLLMAGLGTVVIAYVGDHLSGSDVGAAFGIVTVALGIAQVVAPPIGGWIADHTGSFTATYVVAAAAAILAAAVAMLLVAPKPVLGRRVQGLEDTWRY